MRLITLRLRHVSEVFILRHYVPSIAKLNGGNSKTSSIRQSYGPRANSKDDEKGQNINLNIIYSSTHRVKVDRNKPE